MYNNSDNTQQKLELTYTKEKPNILKSEVEQMIIKFKSHETLGFDRILPERRLYTREG